MSPFEQDGVFFVSVWFCARHRMSISRHVSEHRRTVLLASTFTRLQPIRFVYLQSRKGVITTVKMRNVRSCSYPEHLETHMATAELNSGFMPTEINGRGDSLRWPRYTLYPLNLALTSPTSGGRSVGIVRLQTTGHRVWHGTNIQWKLKKVIVILLFVFLFNCIETNKYRNTRILSFLFASLHKLFVTLLLAVLIWPCKRKQ
jgi:hypothetical protein